MLWPLALSGAAEIWPLKNTATPAASTSIEYPIEKNESGIGLFEVAVLLQEIATQNTSAPEFQSTEFVWDFDWTKPWLGAGSRRIEATFNERAVFSIMLWGGFIRAPGMTMKALEFTLCHEFGHFLGGDPHQQFPGEVEHWSSAEGQADWWAATVCLPKLYLARGLAGNAAQARIEQAGVDFTHFAHITYEASLAEPSIETRATQTPPATLTLAYPTLQCRLDTIRDGAACAFSGAEPKACARPRCWLVP